MNCLTLNYGNQTHFSKFRNAELALLSEILALQLNQD